MQDESIRKMLEINGAIVDAGKRLRESDSITYRIAEQARYGMFTSANQSATLKMALANSALDDFMERERRARAVAMTFVGPFAAKGLLETIGNISPIPSFAIGALAQLRDAGVFATQQRMLDHSLTVSSRMLETFEAGFRLPSSMEAARLATQFDQSATARSLSFVTQPKSLLSAMEQMRTPWLEVANPAVSSASFAAIQRMGDAIRVAPGFDVGISSALRLELGDWRKPIAWPQEIFADLQARSSFYSSLGVNPALTSMPAPAFRETLEVAGLIERSAPVEAETEETETDESGFGRTNEAHDQLQRLEVELRLFIHAVLFAEYGDEWMKRCVPAPTLEEWKEKQQRYSRSTDRVHPLISYADFTDYERIICRKDNWKHFQIYFVRKESVLESLQRLYPIRVDTMHARLITQDDELFLLVEYKRLMRALLKFNLRQAVEP